MLKRLAIGILFLGALAVTSFAAAPAADNAGNGPYNDGWQDGDNGGIGFQPWALNTGGGGGHYIGASGVNQNPSFGLFSGTPSAGADFAAADRNFNSALLAGETFSLQLGVSNSVATGGSVGINLLNGANVVFTFKFDGGGSTWQLNDGGTDFGTTIPFSPNTTVSFSFTYNGADSYSVFITDGTNSYPGNNFMATSDISNITGFRAFSSEQGAGENFGFNNLQVIPEPSSLALLAGPALLGAFIFVRRRRA